VTRRVSAGILLYRYREGELEVLLAHPGGPFFTNRDLGHWTIPKGEVDNDDELLEAAAREFEEETGHPVADVATDDARPIELGYVVQASGKHVHCWAVKGDLDPATASSNTFEMAWPPGSRRLETFPEIDRVAWFPIAEALRRANPSQTELVERLRGVLAGMRGD